MLILIKISDDIHKNNFEKLNWNDLNKNCYVNDSIFLNSIDLSEMSNLILKIPDKSSFYI